MTCIVGLVDNGKVYMGGDSAGVAGLDYQIREDQKVFKNGNMVFGFTSSFRMGQLLQYSLKVPDHDPRDDDFKYMCTTFMSAVIECFKSNGYAKVEANKVSGGNFLVGYNGQLYDIESDFQVGRLNKPFYSVGCGMHYALGALEVLNKNMALTPEEKIIQTLTVVESYSAGVKAPFNIISI